jgi:hypothetical protein
MLALLKRNYEVHRRDGLRWHDLHTRFHEDWCRFCLMAVMLALLKGCNAGINNVRNPWCTSLRWFHVAWFTYQVSWRGLAIAQAVSCQLPTTEGRDWSQDKSCGICGGQSGTGAGFLRALQFVLPIFIPPNASFSSIKQEWYIKPICGRRTEWKNLTPLREIIIKSLMKIGTDIQPIIKLRLSNLDSCNVGTIIRWRDMRTMFHEDWYRCWRNIKVLLE